METSELPWIEKYRPKTLDEMIDHEEKITTLKNLIKKNELPHLLFHGPPGTGKTSLILAAARELYGADYKMYMLELNASDDRGIDIVRTKIPNFVKTKSNKIRLVILDEADAMTQDAQNALRRVMETCIKTSRFCLICNNFNKIVQGIKSRCSIMRFGTLNPSSIKAKVNNIVGTEKVCITDEAISTLIRHENDFRQILNTLQCLHYIKSGGSAGAYPAIDVDDVYLHVGKPKADETAEIINTMFTGQFQETYKKLLLLFRENKWNIDDLIVQLGRSIIEMTNIADECRFYLLQKLSKIEYRIVNGRDSEIQLAALVAAFQKARQKFGSMKD